MAEKGSSSQHLILGQDFDSQIGHCGKTLTKKGRALGENSTSLISQSSFNSCSLLWVPYEQEGRMKPRNSKLAFPAPQKTRYQSPKKLEKLSHVRKRLRKPSAHLTLCPGNRPGNLGIFFSLAVLVGFLFWDQLCFSVYIVYFVVHLGVCHPEACADSWPHLQGACCRS